jgi:hypothetical protein
VAKISPGVLVALTLIAALPRLAQLYKEKSLRVRQGLSSDLSVFPSHPFPMQQKKKIVVISRTNRKRTNILVLLLAELVWVCAE